MSSDQLTTQSDDPPAARPAVSAPDALSPEALAEARRAEPRRGLTGLLFVVPVAILLAAGAGGPAHSLVVIAPISTFALPLVAMIAFWWEDWPGSLLRGAWSGLYDTAIVVVGGVALALLGQSLVSRTDLIGLIAPGPGHPPAYPGTLPLAAGVFTIMLQLTLVCERWPLNGLPRIAAGVAALVACWIIGALGYVLLVKPHVIPSEEYGSWLTSLGVWQMIWYVALRGWPFARIRRRSVRLPVANVVVLACATLTYVVMRHVADLPPGRVNAIAGAGLASVLLVSMLFEAWPAIRLTPLPGRSVALAIVAALTVLLTWTFPLIARATGVPAAQVNGWVTHATLNALSLAVILHVAVWRRWPAGSTVDQDRSP